MRTAILRCSAWLASALLCCASVRAQDAVTPAPANAVPPPTAASAPPPETTCVPACRTGFLCVTGQCISACNPPCDPGDVCTAAGECISRETDAGPLRSDPENVALEPPMSGVHRHDGLFLRATVGPGFGVSGVGDAVDVVYAGGGWTASLDLGGSRGDNLAIFGRLRAASLVAATLWIDDEKIDDVDGTAFQGLAGAGIAYFLMPLNMYLGAAVGLVLITSDSEGSDGEDLELESKVGVGLDLELGKEWWVAADWGIGVGLRASFASAEDDDDDDTRDQRQHGALFVALLLSATYQ